MNTAAQPPAPDNPAPPIGITNELETINGKKQWAIWFFTMTGCCVVMMLLYGIFGTTGTWLDYMTLLILGLFIATLVKSWRDIVFLDRETRLASKQVRQLMEINDIAQFVSASEPSVFRAHIGALHTILMKHSDIRQDSLIEITHARFMARNKVVELFASILITLGLIGTIIGLLLSVGGLQEVIAGGTEMDDIKSGMGKTISGLSTAFYTTLVGSIFGGVILRILTSVVDANIMRYMAHLAELTEVHVLPAMRRIAAQLDASGYYKQA